MRQKLLPALACAAVLAWAGTTTRPRWNKKIPSKLRIEHALNRLTFGPRPGDEAAIRKIGLKKWIDLQLDPKRISENPLLEQKLKTLDSLQMSSEELVRNYPTPQVVQQMVRGQIPFPSDPVRQRMLRRLAVRAEARQNGAAEAALPEPVALRQALSPEEVRRLRTGTPHERLAALEGLPEEKQDEVIAVLPGGMRQALYVMSPPNLRRKIEMTQGPAQVVARDLTEGKLLRAIYSNRQLEEVLTDFWFNHFNIYLDKGADHYLVTEYEREVIRPHVLGKFRDLLEATAKSPAMLFYLDNWQSAGLPPNPSRPTSGRLGTPVPPRNARNRRNGLNENYGRELLELHTLGVNGGYTQKDVTEVARCFTGWTIDRPQFGGGFLFRKQAHDNGEKVVLGVTIPAGGGIDDGEKVLDIIARNPATARHISRELAKRFVADDPPPALVDRMAQTFLRTDGDLRAVMKTMLDSKEFWSEAAYQSKMKSPLEMVVSAVRAVDGDVDFAFALVNQVGLMGEPLYRKIEPTGYSNASAEWLNSAGLLARMNFAVQLAGNKLPGVKVGTADASVLGSPEFQRR